MPSAQHEAQPPPPIDFGKSSSIADAANYVSEQSPLSGPTMWS
jgi:hypothetical protein